MKIQFIFFLLITSLFVLVSCRNEDKKVVKIEPITFNKEGELTIYKTATDSILTLVNIEIADSEYETQTGLMYRETMEEDQGMFFIFSEEKMHSFYMKNTKIALDIVFIDADLKIASFQENTTPLNEAGLSSQIPIQYVLELNAGLVKKWGLKIHDSVTYTKQ
ncbi:MAG: hypothetical protein COA50_11995 [Flavobacteriaceae bacterium]|nr:MAG: hypothetical protein COA50_11995 [Flavobacteriaceae bacterium]